MREVPELKGDERLSPAECALWAMRDQQKLWATFADTERESDPLAASWWRAKAEAMAKACEILKSECEL